MFAGREMIEVHFKKELSKVFNPTIHPIRVAVIGGSANEVEINWLNELGISTIVKTFGIEGVDYLLDLNDANDVDFDFGKYDLIVCCQVIEHIWNIENFFRILTTLVNQDGYIWLNCPASNLKHMSPDFFSAGYQSQFIVKNLQKFGVRPILAMELGTERLYKMTHYLQYWPSPLEHRFPVLRGIHTKKYLFPIKLLKNFPQTLLSFLWSTRVEIGSQWSTESLYFGIKGNRTLDEVDVKREINFLNPAHKCS